MATHLQRLGCMTHKLGRAAIAAGFLAAILGEPHGVRTEQDPWTVATLCTPYSANTRPPISVSNGTELQNALDDARAGDTILLTAGATFHPVASQGSFVLRNKSIPEGQWVIVRSASAAFDPGGAVGPNTRVTPANAPLMAKLRGTRPTTPVLRAEPGAGGYRLIGLDIGPDPAVTQIRAMVELGSGVETSLAAVPHDIVIDRCYIHGADKGNYRRGVAMNGARLSVIESHVDNFHDFGDSQAVGGYNGPGPFKIVNNLLEAASENVLFGGADPRIAGVVPADIEIRRNHMTKRLSWRGSVPVKNAFELKSARRVLVEGNVFEHVWASGQDGTAIVLKSTNQDGGCPHCVTEYVVFRHNIVRHAGGGVTINAAETGRRNVPMPQRVNHVRIENVLFEDITTEWGGSAKLLRVFGGVSDVAVVHVTSVSNARGILDPAGPADVNRNLVFSYNIVERKLYGIGAGADEGVVTLSRNFPRGTYRDNLIVNTSEGTSQAVSDSALKARYPALTTVVGDWAALRFQPGTYKLSAGSPFKRAGGDGKDLGADMDAIERAQTGPGGSADCSSSPATPKPRQQPPQ